MAGDPMLNVERDRMDSRGIPAMRLLLIAATTFSLACGEEGGGPMDVDDPVIDPTIPAFPQPQGPQPMTQRSTGVGDLVRQMPVSSMRVTMVGAFRQELLLDDGDPFDTGDASDRHGEETLYDAEFQDLGDWLQATGALALDADSACAEETTTVAFEPELVRRRVRECVTFHTFDLARAVELQEYRYWVNLGSRVLGPGTDYSLTFSWTEGVEALNGFEFNSTQGLVEVNERNWNRCSNWSASAGFSLGGFSGGGSVSQEECYGGSSATETSSVLSDTYSESITVSAATSRSETRSVTSADGVNRVYTVWQLVNRYSYSNPDGSPIDPMLLLEDDGWTQGVGATEYPAFTQMEADSIFWGSPTFDGGGYYSAGTPRTSVEWTPLFVTWPEGGVLDVMTDFIDQDTRDFTIGG